MGFTYKLFGRILLTKTSGCDIAGATVGTTLAGFFLIGEKKCLSRDSFFTVGSVFVTITLMFGLFIAGFDPLACLGLDSADAVMFPC